MRGEGNIFFKVLEATFVLILVFLVISNATDFSKVMGSISGAYVSSVKVLQGRK
jgi:hypothetical protein